MTVPDIADLPRRTLYLLFVAAAVLAFLGTLVLSDDPDMFHHLALGREIVRNGVPTVEPFLFPLRGEQIAPPSYWLGSVVIYAWHSLFGEPGLSLLPAAVGALLAIVLLADAAPRLGRHTFVTLAAATLPVALALETFRYRAVARTEIFSALLLAVTMLAIRRFEEGRPRTLVALPVLVAVWSNVHPGVAVAFVPLVVHLATAVLLAAFRGRARRSAPDAPSWRQLATVATVLATALAASALNPAMQSPLGDALRFTSSALGLGGEPSGPAAAAAVVVRNIQELRGGGTALWGTPVGVLIALTAVSLLLPPREMRLREIVTIVPFAVLPFLAVRFAMFFAVVAAPIASRNLGAAASALPAALGRISAKRAAAASFLIAAVASLPLGALAPHLRFGAGLARGVFPGRGVDYLQTLGFEGRLFNTFHFGGYLEWREVGPPFQDGRGAVLPADAAAAMAGPTMWPSFVDLDSRYRFDALLVSYPAGDPASGAALGVFEPNRGVWALVAFDDAALLYLRRDGAYAEAAARDEFRVATPAYPLLALPSRDLAGELADYRRAVREATDCFRCRYFLGELALSAHAPEEAARAVGPALAHASGSERAVLESVALRAASEMGARRTAQETSR